ncbi:sigma-70 family RNA polymerase sigma factor [Candidatus Poribacteria bacterium]
MKKYKEPVYALAYSQVHNFHDAQDITQEVFIKAYRKLRDLRRWDNFMGWLCRITSNTCRDWLRSRARRPDLESIDDQDPGMLDRSSMDLHHENMVYESIHYALDSLPELYSQVLVLRYFGGMTTREMSRFLVVSTSTIERRLREARIQLKEGMLAMMSTSYEQNQLPATFMFRIVEAVKRIKINPMPRMAGVPWGLSLAAGIIITILNLNPRISIPINVAMPTSSPSSASMKVLETGEIPVDVLGIPQTLPISGNQDNGPEVLSLAMPKAASEDGVIVFTIDGVIYTMDADGRNRKQLTSQGRENGLDNYVSLSPDGKQMAFARNFAGMYIMNVDGSNMRQLTKNPLHRRSTWSPDGKQIAFEVSMEEEKGGISAINADGSNLRKLVEGPWEAFYPAFSPDGSKIAFSCVLANNPADIYVIDANGANMEKLTFNNDYLAGISWSPDGTKIVSGRMHTVTNTDVYIMDADGKNQTNITNTPGIAEFSPSWSRDGTKIAFISDQGGNLDIYVMDADGSSVQQITNTPKNEREPAWAVSSYAVEPTGKLPAKWGTVKSE